MIIVIRFKYVILSIVCLILLVGILYGRIVTVHPDSEGSVSVTLISFLPLRTDRLSERLRVTSLDPRQQFQIRVDTGYFKVRLQIHEKRFPKGYPITVRLKKLPTWILGFYRSFTKTVIPLIQPAITPAPSRVSGTRNPFEINFTTPLQGKKIEKWIVPGFPAKLAPRTYQYQQQNFTDYATWRVIPNRPLRHDAQYQILIKPGLTSLGGISLGKRQVLKFRTVPPLVVVDRKPAPGSTGVSLAAPVVVKANRRIRAGRVRVTGSSGVTVATGPRLTFIPSQAWLPDTQYRAKVKLVDQFGEQAGSVWQFRTQKLAAPVWAAVKLHPPATLTVYHNKQAVKVILVLKSSQMRSGTGQLVQLGSRGYAFYSRRLKATAYYWLRTRDGTLIHSTLFGPDGRSKPVALQGNGSIQLSFADSKWLYQNLPPDSPLII